MALNDSRPKAYKSFARQTDRPDAEEDIPTSNQNQGMVNFLDRSDKMGRLASNAFALQAQNQAMRAAQVQRAAIPGQSGRLVQPAPSRVQGLRNWVDTDPTVIGMRTSPKKKKMGRRLPPKRP